MQCPDCGTWHTDAQPWCPRCGQVLTDGESGARIGHYRLIERIGQGGMGMVYRAVDETLEREVAIKALHRNLLSDPRQTERFRREARMHGQLSHPNIIALLDVIEEEGLLALVMELLRGCTLKEYLKARGIPPAGEIVWIGDAILAALDAAHAQGVVHRDLKLSNVFLCDDGGLKLMDFGLAKPQRSTREDITESGATVGTYYYMAPEQILGKPIDPRTDLYALGIMLYRIATGALPFVSTGGGEFEIMEKQVRQPPEPPQRLNPDMPPDLAALIMQMLEKSPEDRPGSAAEVAQRLRTIANAEAPRLDGMTFSQLHEKLHGGKRTRNEDDASRSDTGDDADALPHDTLLWIFRHASPEAPATPPLDLRSPPPIRRETLTRLKAAIAGIPPLPDNWQRIRAILDDPESAPADLAREIEHDPVISAHVLKLANSAAWSLPGKKVDNVAIAIARIGMDNIHDFLLQKVMPDFSALAHANAPGLIDTASEMRAIIAHGMCIAAIFRQLADYGRIVEPKAAGAFGMLHDIGKLVILHLEDGETLQELRIAIAGGEPSLKAEWELLGYTHIDAGMMLALHWRLPRSLHRFIYFHHHPAWHTPDAWPVDMQPGAMLNHIAHIVLEHMQDEGGIPELERFAGGIWAADRRTHIPATESLLRHPLRLPLKDVSHYQQLRQNVQRLASTFPVLFPSSPERPPSENRQ